MSETPESTEEINPHRVFLVVIDSSDEMQKALRFASQRAKSTGGKVALLFVQEPTEFTHWLGVDKIMREEAREEGEALLQAHSELVEKMSGSMPIIYIREGNVADELFNLLEEEASISIVVLGASSDSDGTDPIISHLIGKGRDKMRIPFTIVPGSMSDDEIAAVT